MLETVSRIESLLPVLSTVWFLGLVIMWQSKIKITGGIKMLISWLLGDNPVLSRWVQYKRNSERWNSGECQSECDKDWMSHSWLWRWKKGRMDHGVQIYSRSWKGTKFYFSLGPRIRMWPFWHFDFRVARLILDFWNIEMENSKSVLC